MSILFFASIYVVGFFLTLLFLKYYGKKMGFDYSEPKTYANHDDWNSNEEAYTAFSIIWPVFVLVNLLRGLWHLLVIFTKFVIKVKNQS